MTGEVECGEGATATSYSVTVLQCYSVTVLQCYRRMVL